MATTSNFIIKVGGLTITVVENYSALPDPTTVSGKFYWCTNSQGTIWLPGSLGGTFYNSGMYYSNGITWQFVDFPFASEITAGVAKLYTGLGSNTDGAVDQNTVNSALALKANLQNVKQYLISKPVGNYGSITGTTAETVLLSIPILGGVYENGDYLGFNIWTIKNGTAAITTITVRAGTTGTTADSVLGLLGQHSVGQNSAASEREGILFEDGNFINGRTRPVVTQSYNDLGSFVSYIRFALNPSNDWFLTFTATHTNPADEIIVRSYQLSKTKTF